MMSGATQGVQQGTPGFVASVTSAGQQASTAMTNSLRPIQTDVAQIFTQTWAQAEQATTAGIAQINVSVTQLGTGVEAQVQQLDTEVTQGITQMWTSVDQEFDQGGQQAVASSQRTVTGIEQSFQGLENELRVLGYNAMVGFTQGIDQEGQVAVQHAEFYAQEVAQVMRMALMIQSPSEVMREIGKFVMAGLHAGLDERGSEVLDWLQGFAHQVASAFHLPVTDSQIDAWIAQLRSAAGAVGGGAGTGGAGGGSGGSGGSGQGGLDPLINYSSQVSAAFDKLSEQVSEQGGQLSLSDPRIRSLLEQTLGKGEGDAGADWLSKQAGSVQGEQFPVTLTTDTRINNLSASERGIAQPGGGDLHIHVAGSVIDTRDLFRLVQQEALKNGYRNPTAGLSVPTR
jgi:hypothetical protein